MLRLSTMMFLQFFIWGSWFVTTATYMTARGWDGEMIGNVYTMGPIAAVVAPIFLGLIADRFFASQVVLGVLHVVGGAIMLAVPSLATDAETFVLCVLVYMLCYMPTLGLTNTIAFHNIVDREKQFPMVRVFGTIGWIAAGYLVSKVLKADYTATQYYVAGGASIALGVFSFVLPNTPPPAKGKKVSLAETFGLGALPLLRSPAFAVFIVCSWLICIPLAGYYSFGNLFAGTEFAEPASVMIWGQVAEVVFMVLMPLFFARLGVKWMLAVGMLAWVARYGLFSGAADGGVAWMIVAGILLHGICYDFFFVTGQIYVDKRCSPEVRGQAQSFLVVVTQGLGLGIGAQLMGRSHAALTTGEGDAAVTDWTTFWWQPALGAAVVLVLFVLLFRDRSVEEARAG